VLLSLLIIILCIDNFYLYCFIHFTGVFSVCFVYDFHNNNNSNNSNNSLISAVWVRLNNSDIIHMHLGDLTCLVGLILDFV